MSAGERRGGAVSTRQVEAVMAASRALVGMAAASVAEVDDIVTVPQLRVLMMIATRGPMNLGSVATALGVSAPNASRICDRVLKAGLLHRSEDPADRRNITLTLTDEGHALIDRVAQHRRAAIKRVLRKMSARDRETLAHVLDVFAEAAGEPLNLDVAVV
ncbi:MarR family transcriptional regulator [Mycobacterium sp. NPDC048908]|uniref:MarR family transcriptional regulator n=1 Tax=Mycobacterium sp. NPDC048908 TaxID=3364292 RepID=UPI00371A5FDA